MENKNHEIGDSAIFYFNKGFSCSESVAKAVSLAMGCDLQNITKIATPFSGGIASQGYICGSVSGALIALGLNNGRMSPNEDRDTCNELAREFTHSFLREFKSLDCQDIIGVNLLTEEGRKELKEHLRSEKCCSVVKFAAEEIYRLIKSLG